MNCDRLAPYYRLVERTAFGTRLERHRFRFLNQLTGAKRVLSLGEGDGRFLARFLTINSHASVDCVDLSSRMLKLAGSRIVLPRDAERVHFMQADATRFQFEAAAYDLVVTNFFLDCFEAEELAALVSAIASACQRRARWLITEFHQPASGWRARHAAVWLAAMYAFFRLATGLRVAHLPNHRPALEGSGFHLLAAESSLGELVTSELWVREV